jgi:tripartite-type tricarboxylate transporter receptor subunit TctC
MDKLLVRLWLPGVALVSRDPTCAQRPRHIRRVRAPTDRQAHSVVAAPGRPEIGDKPVSSLSFLFVIAVLSTLSITSLSAATFPERPIRVVIGSAPGGIFDAVGRIWADKVKQQLKSVIIDHQPGAGSSRAAAAVSNAPADGYTLFLGGSITNVINSVARSNLSYDPMGFQPVSLLGSNSYAFVVHPSVPVNSLQELVTYSRQHPAAISYGTTGAGSLNHLTGELFKSVAKAADIAHVPYRGAGPAFADLLSGQIPLAVVSFMGQIMDFHRFGKIRVLAVTSPQRLHFASEIPTTAEVGLASVNTQQFVGLFAPPNTPRALVDEIARATKVAVASQDYRDRFAAAGFEAFPDASPEKMDQVNKQLYETWAPVIKSIGLKLD